MCFYFIFSCFCYNILCYFIDISFVYSFYLSLGVRWLVWITLLVNMGDSAFLSFNIFVINVCT